MSSLLTIHFLNDQNAMPVLICDKDKSTCQINELLSMYVLLKIGAMKYFNLQIF